MRVAALCELPSLVVVFLAISHHSLHIEVEVGRPKSDMAVTDAPAPNPNDNVSRLVYIPSAIFMVICPLVVALRVWARLRSGKMGPDDWTAIAALVNISGPD